MNRRHLQMVAAGVTACVLTGTAAQAVVVIAEDDFESYSSTEEMRAVWSGGPGELVTDFGNPGQSAAHAGGTVNERTFDAIMPTALEPIVLSGQLFDDGVGGQDAVSLGLRGPAINIIELGHWDDPNSIGDSQYAFRLILFGAGDPNWVAFDVDGQGGNESVEGWHTYSATILPDSITLTLDLQSNGVIDALHTVDIVTTDAGYTSLRFGGPSNTNRPNGVVNFDNISLIQVPEPASLSLLGLAGLGMIRRRR